MYPFILITHSWLRWVVLIVAVAAAGKALAGWLGKRDWTALDDRLGLVFTIGLDLQFLVGLILYIVSPLTQAAVQNFGAAMANSVLRFFSLEHVVLMVVAIALAHVGRALAQKATGIARHRRAAIFYGLALLVILSAIPWPFRFADLPWFRLS
jgi:hypothetical protein